MPTFVRTEKCDGCKGQDKTACMYICPHDLMKLDKDGSDTGHAMKAYNQEPEQCWECYSCVKICLSKLSKPVTTLTLFLLAVLYSLCAVLIPSCGPSSSVTAP